MSTARVRSRTRRKSGFGTRSYRNNGGSPITSTSSAVDLEYHYCADWIGTPPYIDQPLLLYKKKVRPLLANGVSLQWNSLGSYSYEYENYRWLRSQLGYCPAVPSPDWVELKNRAIISLNPNVPPVDVLNFIFELREIPKLLRDLGNVALGNTGVQDGPRLYLGYQFGIKPLISDLKALLTFGEDFDRRLSDLYKAGKKRKIRRRIYSYDDTSTLKPLSWLLPFPSYGTNVAIKRVLTKNHRSWYTCNLTPAMDYPSSRKDFVEQFRKASRLSSIGSSVWNSLPWTWLIDYFASIGSFIEATSGRLPYVVSNMNIMYKSDDVERHEAYRPKYVRNGPVWYTDDRVTLTKDASLRTTAKQRVTHAYPQPSIDFHPVLTKRQTNILTALFLARFIDSKSGAYNG